jgi:drug/metabolite transporter (DMT)-like permease
MVTFTVIILFAKKGAKNLSLLRDIKLLKWLVLIAVLTIAYRFSEILAIKIAPVALVLSVKRLSIFIAVIVGGKIFKEKNLIKKLIAAGIILAGSFLITL